MKSITCYFSSNYNGINFIYMILTSTIYFIRSASSTPRCGLFGELPCPYLPVPRGQTPTCAGPGQTYCERIDNYPTSLIKNLIQLLGETKDLLLDELSGDFEKFAWQDTPAFYEPPYISSQLYNNGKDFNGYSYDTPPYGSRTGNGNGYGNINSNYNYDPYRYTKSSATKSSTNTIKFTPNTPRLWLKRLVNDFSKKSLSNQSGKPPLVIDTGKEAKSTSTRDVSINMNLWDIVGARKGPNNRFKREDTISETLCKSNSQFITPQAAMNRAGDWMFVVNKEIPRQRIKTEVCASNGSCSNLCTLPNGYTSRCEQKFVQRRMITIKPDGRQLYTDSFWFPSCCVCTIFSPP